MKRTPATLAAAVITIGAAGFLAGRLSSPAPDGASTAASDAPAIQTRANRGGNATSPDQAPPRTTATERGRTGQSTASTPEQRRAQIEDIMRGENALDRGRALLTYIDRLGPGDFEDAIAHFRGLGITEDRMGEYSLLLTAWAKADPAGALDYTVANTRGDFARNTILTAWATNDPDAALRWAEANHTGDGPNRLLIGVIRGVASTDPARATQIMASMPRSEERGRALDSMMPHVMNLGIAGARDWVATIDDEWLRNGALERLTPRLASLDPATAADLLIANPGRAQERRMDDVYREWARMDQSAALTAMNSLPTGDIRSNALRGIASSIASSNPQEALSLLARYPADVNDRVLVTTAWSAYRTDPAVSAGLISRVSDERTQDHMYRRTLETWLQSDPDAALNWINSNPVPDSVLSRIAERL